MDKICDNILRKTLKDLDLSTLDALKLFMRSFYDVAQFLREKDLGAEFYTKVSEEEVINFLKCVTASTLVFIESALDDT